MSEKKLNDKDLENVAGGRASDEFLPADKGEWIPKDNARSYIGKYVYVVDDYNNKHFGWGKLINSDKMRPHDFSANILYHVIDIQGRMGCGSTEIQYGQQAFAAANWTLYKQNPIKID